MQARRLRAAGFTLVEMLVVTIIIGILASLTSVAVLRAVDYARRFAVYSEEKNLDQSMRQLMSDFVTTTWPPCDLRMSSATDLNQPIALYFKRVYPHYDITKLYTDLQNNGVNTATFDPGHALVFWLAGFNPDVTQPLLGHAARMSGQDNTRWIFPFDTTRLVKDNNAYVHYLMYGSTTFAVYDNALFASTTDTSASQLYKYRGYLYFDNYAGNYGTLSGTTVTYYNFHGFTPYYYTGTPNIPWNRDTCQIIASGSDQILGAGGPPPNANVSYMGFDADNMANFGGGNNMKAVYEILKQL